MFFIGVVLFFVIFQWLSIWAAVAKIDKSKKDKRNKTLKHLFCTIGLPALVSLIATVPFLWFLEYSWIPCIIIFALDIIFGVYGTNLERKIFVKQDKKRTK